MVRVIKKTPGANYTPEQVRNLIALQAMIQHYPTMEAMMVAMAMHVMAGGIAVAAVVSLEEWPTV